MKYIHNEMTFNAILTTAESLNSDLNIFKRIEWDYVIIDEGHKIKNIESNLAKNVRTLKCDYRLLLTGTPIQNNIKELWALLNFLMPKVFSNSDDFQELFDLISEDETKE